MEKIYTAPHSSSTPGFQIAPQADATANELPIAAGTMNSLLQKFHSEPLPQETLYFENAPTIPVEIWLNILPFLVTKQGIAPLRQVSTAFKKYADHPMFADLSYAELDYSSPLHRQIKLFRSPLSSRPYCIAATSSSGFVAIGYLPSEHNLYDEPDLYYVGLKRYKKDVAANNDTQVESAESFQKKLVPLEKTESIVFVIELKKNIFVSTSNNGALRVWDLEKK